MIAEEWRDNKNFTPGSISEARYSLERRCGALITTCHQFAIKN